MELSMRKPIIGFALLLWPCLAVAQSTFWQTPGEIVRDEKGNVTIEELKDPRTFTMRVNDHGKWALTLHYRPNTDKVTQVEAADFTMDLGYAADPDTADSVTIRGYGRALSIRGTREVMSTEGMHAVRMERDSRGRDVQVT